MTEDQLDFEMGSDFKGLKYVGGVDISFIKGDDTNACAALVILSFPQLQVVYTDYEMVKLTKPYIPFFLAFREVEHLLPLLERVKREKSEIYPQVLFVDGNGFFHKRGFGLACHLGVLSDIPTIGVGKNFLVFDGMDAKKCKQDFKENCKSKGAWREVKGASGTVWAAAFQSTGKLTNPVFISVGHRVSLQTACALSTACCKVRVPEPVRQADSGSRDFLSKRLKKEEN